MTGNIFSVVPRNQQGQMLFTLTDQSIVALSALDIIEVVQDMPSQITESDQAIQLPSIILLFMTDNSIYFLDEAWWSGLCAVFDAENPAAAHE